MEKINYCMCISICIFFIVSAFTPLTVAIELGTSQTTNEAILTEEGQLQISQNTYTSLNQNLIAEGEDIPLFVPNQIIVKYKTTKSLVDTLLTKKINIEEKFYRVDTKQTFNQLLKDSSIPTSVKLELSRVLTLDIRTSEILDIESLANEYSKDSTVTYAEPNYLAKTCLVPNDPRYSEQWAHQKTQAELGWDIEQGDSNIIIAIVDTGVDYTHEDLQQNIFSFMYDFVDIDYIHDYAPYGLQLIPGEDYTIPDVDPSDFNGHGTHCAGIAAGIANNGVGISGVAPECKIMPVRAGFSMNYYGTEYALLEYDDIAAAIYYAVDNGADIISMSFGGPYSSIVYNAIIYAAAHDVLLVAAAGNEDSEFESYPAGYGEVIAVAATAQDDTKAWYSNYGDWVDIAAPGGDSYKDTMILSTVPLAGGNLTHPSGYRFLQGTSMACPYIAGALGLLKSNHPTWSADILKLHLLSAVDWINESQGDIGSGRINLNRLLNNSENQSQVIINDIECTDSGGDGYPHPGETISAGITLQSLWFPSIDVTANLSTSDDTIEIITPTQYYGYIDPGSPVNKTFIFYILPVENEEYDVEFTLEVTMLNGQYEMLNFIIHVDGFTTCLPRENGWAITMGDDDYDQANSVCYDQQGNMFITGQFSGHFDFDPTEGVDIYTCRGGSWDVFVTKINADNSYGWTITIGDIGAEAGRSIVLDQNNNIIITGEFCDPNFNPGYQLDFDPTEGIDVHTTNGMTDVFITKINADGSYGWTRTFGGQQFEQPYSTAVDINGNIYLTGFFMAIVDFDPTTGIDYHIEPTGQTGNVFITKLCADGSYGWTRTFGGGNYDTGFGITTDLNGNILVTGYFIGSTYVEGWGTIPAYGYEDIYIAKMNPNGTYQWFYTLGSSTFHDSGGGIAADTEGNVYFTGHFSNTLDMNPTSGVNMYTSHGDFDIFITKLTGIGNYLWTRTLGGTDYDMGRKITIDQNGDPVVAGIFEGVVDFDFNSATQDIHQSYGSQDVFVTKIHSNGDYVSTLTFGGINWDEVYGLDVDENSNIVTVGKFMGTVDFDPDIGFDNRTSSSNYPDIFINRINSENLTGNYYINSIPSNALVYLDSDYKGMTNPTLNLTGVPIGNHTVKLVKSGYQNWTQTEYLHAGQTIEYNVNLTPMSTTGNYIVTSTPPNASVWIQLVPLGGWMYYGQTPRFISNVTIGNHTVMVSKGGYTTWFSPVEYLDPAETIVYHANLTPVLYIDSPTIVTEQEWFNVTVYGANQPLGNVTVSWQKFGTSFITNENGTAFIRAPPISVVNGSNQTSFINYSSIDILSAEKTAYVTYNVSVSISVLLGDMNLDGTVDFSDLNAFILGLISDPVYRVRYGMPAAVHGDCNQDGVFNFDDINAFIQLLMG